MTPALQRARHYAVSSALVLAFAGVWPLAAQTANQQRNGNQPLVRGDQSALHRKLADDITEFQDKWRKAWRAAELKRHKPIDLNQLRGWNVTRTGLIDETNMWLGDRDAQIATPDLRRYEAILCYIGSPPDRAIEDAKSKARTKIGNLVTKEEIAKTTSELENTGKTPRPTYNPGHDATPPGVIAPGTKNNGSTAGARSNLGGAGLKMTGGATLSTATAGVSGATSRIIKPTPDFGAICPSWSPTDLPLPLDEGEAIDLALPPGGREPLRRQRDVLIQQLQTGHLQNPNDDWVSGQLVRFVYDQRNPLRTIEAAKSCANGSPWCTSLQALAQEQAGNVVEAELKFRAVDSITTLAMPDTAKLCVGSETLLLLPEGDRDKFRDAGCQKQRDLMRQMWWLADPLWSVPGNERYVAHESRRLSATLRSVNERDERYIWKREGGGDAMRELVVRFGWPGYTYWPGITLEDEINTWLETATTRQVFMPHTAVEYSSDRTALIPKFEAIANPFKLTKEDYELNVPAGKTPEEWWPQEHMMLFTKLLEIYPGQNALWRRDTVISFQLAIDDPLRNLDTAATGLSKAVLMGGYSPTDNRTFMSTGVGAGHTLRLQASLTSAPVVMSAEILPRTLKEHAMRMRYGLQPPPTLHEMKATDVAISDPLFMRMPNRTMNVPNDEKNVLRYMAGALSFARAEPVGVYWESYGFKPGDSVEVSMTVRRNDDVNVARKLGSVLGIVSALRDSIAVKWTEPDARHGALVLNGAKPVVGRSVALDLHSLPAGNYVLIVEMKRAGNSSAKTEREFAIRER